MLKPPRQDTSTLRIIIKTFKKKEGGLWHYIFDLSKIRSSIHAGLLAMTDWSL